MFVTQHLISPTLDLQGDMKSTNIAFPFQTTLDDHDYWLFWNTKQPKQFKLKQWANKHSYIEQTSLHSFSKQVKAKCH